MDRGFTAAVAFYVASVLLVSVIIAAYATAARDVSWIETIENYVKKENWEPDREYIPLMLTALFLIQNGETQFFYLYSEQEFVAYATDLLNRVDRQIGKPITYEQLEEICASDTVLELLHRFPTKLGLLGPSYGAAYFVLEDKLAKGLEGAIILYEPHGIISVWQITDWALW